MRPQYTGTKVLQTLACGQGQRGAVSSGLWVPLHPKCDPARAHLDELLLGVEVGYNDVLAVRHASQGDAQAAAGVLVAVSRQDPQQAATDDLHQVERGVKRAQEPLPGLLRHFDDVGTSLTLGRQGQGSGAGIATWLHAQCPTAPDNPSTWEESARLPGVLAHN